MATAVQMLGREALLGALLGALGAGAASLLPAWVPRVARVAIAPSFGLAILSGVTITAAQFMSMSTAAPAVLAPLILISLVVAALAERRRGKPLGDRRRLLRSTLALVALAAVPAVSLNIPLADAGSPGPQAYRVDDAVTYAQLAGIFQGHAWTDRNLGPPWDQPAQGFRALLDSDLFQTTGSAPALAAGASLYGWDAIDTQSAFMVTLVGVGALAIFAVVASLGGVLLAALAAGLLFGGPLAYQLTVDGSQAALQSLALIPGIGLCCVVALRRGLICGAVLAAILVAGVIPTYPLLLPLLGASLLLGALVAAALAWRAGRLERRGVRRGVIALVGIALLAAALTPVATERSARYLHSVGTGLLEQPIAVAFGQHAGGPTTQEILPRYDLPAQTLPGWVLQTRDFYGLETLCSSLSAFLRGAIAPLALLALIALGLLRVRDGWVFLCALPVAATLALYSSAGQDCSYCVQRNLLILGPCAAIGLGLGLAALARRGERGRLAAVVSGIAILALVAVGTARMARRAVEDGTVFPAAARALAADAGPGQGSLELEGFALSPAANTESPAIYALLRQTSERRLSTLPAPDQLLGRSAPSTDPFDPAYTEVLTRLGGVLTDRRTIAHDGPYSLQRRFGPFDATVASGVSAQIPSEDPRGIAWVTGPLGFVVAAPPRVQSSLRISLTGPGVASVRVAAPARVALRSPGSLDICAPLRGPGSLRVGTISIGAVPAAGTLRLSALSAFRGPCPAPAGVRG